MCQPYESESSGSVVGRMYVIDDGTYKYFGQ